jgi:hypothetical protein
MIVAAGLVAFAFVLEVEVAHVELDAAGLQRNGKFFGLHDGCICYRFNDPRYIVPLATLYPVPFYSAGWSYGYGLIDRMPVLVPVPMRDVWGAWIEYYIPLWPAPALFGAIAFLKRRRRSIGFCKKCGYDRVGLAASARCPECGAGSG